MQRSKKKAGQKYLEHGKDYEFFSYVLKTEYRYRKVQDNHSQKSRKMIPKQGSNPVYEHRHPCKTAGQNLGRR